MTKRLTLLSGIFVGFGALVLAPQLGAGNGGSGVTNAGVTAGCPGYIIHY